MDFVPLTGPFANARLYADRLEVEFSDGANFCFTKDQWLTLRQLDTYLLEYASASDPGTTEEPRGGEPGPGVQPD